MNEYLYGNLFGLTQVMIGYPFDTLKIYIQNSKSIIPLLNSPKLFYKGVQYPLITSMLGTSLMFGNYSYFLDLFGNKFVAASTTGIIGAFFITPFDYLKIQKQIHNQQYKNFKNIKITHLYCGNTLTILRESFAIPAYFLTFDYLYYNYQLPSFLSGGIAGINSWLFTYPLDTLKSRKQSYHTKSLQELIFMGSLYNGLGITLLRSFIVNGTSFYLYSKIRLAHTK